MKRDYFISDELPYLFPGGIHIEEIYKAVISPPSESVPRGKAWPSVLLSCSPQWFPGTAEP